MSRLSRRTGPPTTCEARARHARNWTRLTKTPSHFFGAWSIARLQATLLRSQTARQCRGSQGISAGYGTVGSAVVLAFAGNLALPLFLRTASVISATQSFPGNSAGGTQHLPSGCCCRRQRLKDCPSSNSRRTHPTLLLSALFKLTVASLSNDLSSRHNTAMPKAYAFAFRLNEHASPLHRADP